MVRQGRTFFTHSRLGFLFAAVAVAGCFEDEILGPRRDDSADKIELGDGPPGGGGAGSELQRALEDFLTASDRFPEALALFEAYERRLAQSPSTAGGELDDGIQRFLTTAEATDTLFAASDAVSGIELPADLETGASALPTIDAAGCGGVSVIYVNGLFTQFPVFTKSVAELRRAIRERLPGAKVFGVYNTSATDAERSVFGARVCPSMGAGAKICRWVGGSVIDLAQAIEQHTQAWALFGGVRDPDHRRLRRAIERELNRGRSVILVPHSQGNLIARDVLARMAAEGMGPSLHRVGAVMTGSPISAAELQPFLGSRVLRVDRVGDLVALLGNPLMTGAISGSEDCSICPHYFQQGYLTGDARAAVVDRVLQTLQQLLPQSAFAHVNIRVVETGNQSIGLRVEGLAACLVVPHDFRAIIQSTVRGAADSERQVLSLGTLSPSDLSFGFTTGAVRNCQAYTILLELRDRIGGPTRTAELFKEVGSEGAGTAYHRLLMETMDDGRGAVLGNNTVTYSSEAAIATVGPNLVIENSTNPYPGLGWMRIWMVYHVDDVQPFSADCLEIEGSRVRFAGRGWQKVRVQRRYGTGTAVVDIAGTVSWTAVDSVDGDTVEVTFTANPSDSNAYRAVNGTWRFRPSAPGAVRIVLGG